MTREEAIRELEEENNRFQWLLNNAGEDIFPFQRNIISRDIDRNKVAISALKGFEGMTNGEVIQALFPNIDKGFSNVIDLNLWWNAKYKAESEE